MISKLLNSARPNTGYSNGIYYLLNALLPIIVLIIVILGFPWVAAVTVVVSKWRMFAMKPRYWLPNIRANAVDIIVGLSVVAMLANTDKVMLWVFWTTFYIFWMVWLKPKSKQVPVMAQALLAQALALIAYYQTFPDASVAVSVAVVWVVCYTSARHFLGAFDEEHYRQISAIWAWFGATLAWVLGHWVITYLLLPQIALIITVIGYGLAFLYYLYANHRLTKSVKFQITATILFVLSIIIVFSDWQNKIL